MSADTRAGAPVDEEPNAAERNCPHPARRIFAWVAYDGSLCAGCCECGTVLAGEAQPLTGSEEV